MIPERIIFVSRGITVFILLIMTSATQLCVSCSDVLFIGEHHHQTQNRTHCRVSMVDVFIYVVGSSIVRSTEQRGDIRGIS